MDEFREVGIDEFLRRHAHGRKPFSLFIRHDGVDYPFKALWAAAHRPQITATDFGYRSAIRPLEDMGFGERIHLRGRKSGMILKDSVEDREAFLGELFEEGERYTAEVELIRRNKRLVSLAKGYFKAVCEACGFDFGDFYGEHGEGYIECHHVDPLASRDASGLVTPPERLAMLCANCHRMVHRGEYVLTVNELKEIIERNRST
jgi:hypothetical protein